MIKLENVISSRKDNNTKYLTHLSGETLVKLVSSGDLRYNALIQRGIETKKVKGRIVKTPIASQKKIKNIYDDMRKNKFFESMIVLNVTEDNASVLEYNDGTIAIYSHLDILDGYHRIQALLMLKKDKESDIKPEDFYFPVEITRLDTDSAQNKFYQLTLGAKISTSRAQYFNHEDAANKIIRSLMENELKNRVEVSKNVIPKKSLEKVVTFATLSNALKANIDLETLNENEINSLTAFLNHFFSEIFVMYDGFYDDDVRYHQSNKLMVYDNFMFYGYVALALYIYRDHKECMDGEYGDATKDIKLIHSINFEKSDPIWREVVVQKEDKYGNTKYVVANNMSTRRIVSTIIVRAFKEIKEEMKNKENENIV